MRRCGRFLPAVFLLVPLEAGMPQDQALSETTSAEKEASLRIAPGAGNYRVGPPRVVASGPLVSVSSATYSPFVPLLHLDAEGKVHLLWYPWARPPEARAHEGVEHRIFEGAAWSPVEVVRGTEKLKGMRGVQGTSGGFQLLWCEEQGYHPEAHPERIYLQRWAAARWADAEHVVDDADAGPSCRGREELGFATAKDGSEMVFWNDWREDHFFKSLTTGEGQYPKTYYKVHSPAGWSEARRIHRRGKFFVTAFSVFSTSDGAVHLFWLESNGRRGSRGYDRVLHMVNKGDGWSNQEKLAENRDDDGNAGHSWWLDSATDRDGRTHLAWIWATFASQSPSSEYLDVREYSQGQWGEPVTVSTSATGARWVQRSEGEAVLLFQEGNFAAPTFPRDLGGKLYLARVENGSFAGKVLISDETFRGVFDAIEDFEGRIHVVTVEVRQPDRADLVHRILERSE